MHLSRMPCFAMSLSQKTYKMMGEYCERRSPGRFTAKRSILIVKNYFVATLFILH